MPKISETHENETYRIPTPDGPATMVRTWQNTQIEHLLRGALDIVDQLDPPEDLRQAVFASALNLSGQMSLRDSGIARPRGISHGVPLSAIENGAA